MQDHVLACAENLPSQKAHFSALDDLSLARTAAFYADQFRTTLDPRDRDRDKTFYALVLPELLRRLAPGDPRVARYADILAAEGPAGRQGALPFFRIPTSAQPLPCFAGPAPELMERQALSDGDLVLSAEFHCPDSAEPAGSPCFEAALVHVVIPEMLRRLRLRE